ncbi:MAG: hypothetical protein HYX21_03245 [Candidatus Yanofskybacteria bacterium]|nr:hypothetical protein [Candidatus Yanofskybacteria bacterium]
MNKGFSAKLKKGAEMKISGDKNTDIVLSAIGLVIGSITTDPGIVPITIAGRFILSAVRDTGFGVSGGTAKFGLPVSVTCAVIIIGIKTASLQAPSGAFCLRQNSHAGFYV